MNKKVVFIECKSYAQLKKKALYINGVVYPSAGDIDAGTWVREYGCIEDCQGEFFSVVVDDNGKARVISDFCGFYSLFYKEHSLNGRFGVLVSNCFHSLASYSNSSVNPTKLIANIASKNQIFAQDYTDSTCLDDIRRLGWDEEIVVGSKSFEVLPKRKSVVLDYESLLKKGIEKARETLRWLSGGGSLNLYLSGGKDSRAILGLLLSSGIAPRCTTHDPGKYEGSAKKIVDKDFLIASFLVKKYCLEWYQVGSKRAEKLSFMDSLEHHSFFRDGYYRFSPAQYLVYSKCWGSEIQLRGGGGGLFKSTWGEYIKKSYVGKKLAWHESSLKKDAEILYDELNHSKGLPRQVQNNAREIFVNSLQELSQKNCLSNIYTALDSHYVAYRNRSHFGHIGSSMDQGKKVFYPLVNEFFFEASMLLSEEDRVNGKLVFDIIEEVMPELNEYPYDDGYHPMLVEAGRRKTVPESNSDIDSFLYAQEVSASSTRGLFSGKPYNTAHEELKFIDQSSEEVFDSLGGGFSNQKFVSYFTSLKEDKKNRGKLCALLSSAPISTTNRFAKCHEFVVLNT